MRQQQSGSRYAAGTKIDSHRSRAELARLLTRYGASDFVFLEHDANATIRFALHGKYVQYVLPLPDPDGPDFTHTPTGRPRAFTAQERAYEQAVRQQWRRAVLVMKGKLEAVESGLSTFEREFFGAIQDDERRERPAPLLLRRKLRWAPETMLLILCLGVLVPAGGAVALGVPAVAVERLASPVVGDEADPLGASGKKVSASKNQALQLGTGASLAVVSASSRSTVGAPAASEHGVSANNAGARDDGGAGDEGGGEEAAAGGTPGQGPTDSDSADSGGQANDPGQQKPDKQKPDKGKDKGQTQTAAAPSQPKPDKPKPDKGKNKDKGQTSPSETTGGQPQGNPGSDNGAGQDKGKNKGAEKGGKGAGGATPGKKK